MKNYRDTWELLETKNLQLDVQTQIAHQSYDRLYREHYAARDEAEMEKVIAEAIAAAENVQTAEGDDPLTELEKEVITRKARFSQLGRAFHAPKEREIYNGKQDAGNRGDNRVSSAMSSVKGSANDKKSIDADAEGV